MTGNDSTNCVAEFDYQRMILDDPPATYLTAGGDGNPATGRDLLDRMSAAIDGLCPCGADPVPGSAYCGDDCTPTHIGPSTDRREAGEYATPMRWRPDLVAAHDDSELNLIGSGVHIHSGHNTAIYRNTTTGQLHLRLDDGHRFVGMNATDADVANGYRPLWERLARELNDTRHVDTDPWPELRRLTDEQQAGVCAWLHANNVDPGDVPRDAAITVRPDSFTLEIVVLDGDGRPQIDPDRLRTLTEQRTFPLTARWPAGLRIPGVTFTATDADSVLTCFEPDRPRLAPTASG